MWRERRLQTLVASRDGKDKEGVNESHRILKAKQRETHETRTVHVLVPCDPFISSYEINGSRSESQTLKSWKGP